MTKSQKIIIISILIQVSALVYGIINRAEEVIVMTLIFIRVSVIEFFIVLVYWYALIALTTLLPVLTPS